MGTRMDEWARTDVAVDEPGVCRAPHCAADAYQTMLLGAGEQRCRWWVRLEVEEGCVGECAAGQLRREYSMAATYTGSAIALAVRLYPAHVLAATIAPLGQDLAPALEPVSGATAYPEKDEGRVRGERGDRELL